MSSRTEAKLFVITVRRCRVGSVADSGPQDLWWRPQLFEQKNEVAVFSQHDSARLPGGEEDLAVLSIAQAEFANRMCFYAEFFRDPSRKVG